jgi:hypothetical protein
MKRREILKYTAFFTGAAVSAPLFSTILSGCKSDVGGTLAEEHLHFFNADSFELLKSLVDTILPKTDSPSASDVGVHTMIDSMVGTVYGNNDRKEYKSGFEALTKALNKEGEKSFVRLSDDQKIEVLNRIESSNGLDDIGRTAYLNLKQQTIAYYLATEQIGKEFLNYLPIPGSYEPCITLESVGGKRWAL